MDGTLLEVWASLKSFPPKDGGGKPSFGEEKNPSIDFRDLQQTNDTHESTTDAEAKLARKESRKKRSCVLPDMS